MEEAGYANIFSIKDSSFAVGVRTKADSGSTLPDRFRLYGFSVWIPAEDVTTGTFFKFYDGDSTVNPSTPLWTMRFWQDDTGLPGSVAWNASNMMMQDDSYIQVDNGVYWELTSSDTDARADSGITVYF